MLRIISNLRIYEYENEIHALAKAFFPGAEVSVEHLGGPANEQACLLFAWDEKEAFRVYPDTGGRDPFKRSLYQALCEKTGKSLPWGSLTGIRPVRLAMRRLDAGMEGEAVVRDMEEQYLLSREKALLCREIAVREREILSRLSPKEGISLYLHIPFCPSRCLYCSFASESVGKTRDRVRKYLEALFLEIRGTARILNGRPPESGYIGGGTPTALLTEELEELFTVLEESFDLSGMKEFTVEAGRPDSIDRERLRLLKRHGVSRISVNPQTMRDETLERIGRKHTREDVIRAFLLARDEGFDNINMDIILGLPGEGIGDVQYTLEEIGKLSPDSLTVHSLAVKRGSMLAGITDREEADDRDMEKMMRLAMEGARAMGLMPYYLYRQKNMTGNLENTGFAKPGKYGIYNILINEEVQDIAAMGAGAISKRVDDEGTCRRSANFKETHRYIADVEEMIRRKQELFAAKET
ncbi:MAG: coproporphyrinogen dehydrogenase HemZ [Lachnospiraceae bacterium]|nr:coproporphyrinogen dehydrogenase HemZ [Lachnospiraceae bacterium]